MFLVYVFFYTYTINTRSSSAVRADLYILQGYSVTFGTYTNKLKLLVTYRIQLNRTSYININTSSPF
jgi:hypothetical protein